MESVRMALRNESVHSLLWRYSLPAMLGMLLHAINAIIDRIFVAQAVGEEGLAALSVAFPIFTLLLALTLWIGTGASTLLSLKIGESNDGSVHSIHRAGLTSSLIILPLIGIGIYFLLDPLLILCGGNSSINPEASSYLKPLSLGFIAWGFSTYVSSALRSFDKPKLSLLIVSMSPLLNILLDYIFLFHLEMGMYGAGLATTLAYGGSALVAGICLSSIRTRNNSSHTPIPNAIKSILHFGLAVFLLQLSGAVFHAMINFQAEKYGGIEALAILGVIFTLAGFIFMPVVGIGQGMQPILGVNTGSKNHQRTQQTLKLSTFYGTAILTAAYSLIMLFPEWFLCWFFTESIIENATHATRISFILMPLIAFQIIIIHYFQAVGRPNRSTALVVTRQVILLPILLLTLPRWFSLDAVWLVSPVSDGVMFVVTLLSYLLYSGTKRRSRESCTIA